MLNTLDIQILDDLAKARKVNSNKQGSNFSSLAKNEIQPTTEERKTKKSVLNNESKLDKENRNLESEIEKMIYNKSLEFSDLALIGFLTLKIFSNIELFEDGTKDSNLLLSHKRNLKEEFMKA